MKLLKTIGVSILQSCLYALLSSIIIKALISLPGIPENGAASIGIIGSANGPMAVLLSSTIFDCSPWVQIFATSFFIMLIANLSALVSDKAVSLSIHISCNLLLILYCFVWMSYSYTILSLMILVSIIILNVGYLFAKGVIDT